MATPTTTASSRSKLNPVPGFTDLYPHIAVLDDPGNPMHGEVIIPVRTLALMIAPSVEVFRTEWDRQAGLIALGAQKHHTLPPEWQPGHLRRSKELQARYNTTHAYTILRGLHREYGVFPTGTNA